MLEKAYIAINKLLMMILVMTQEEESYREIRNLLRECLSCHEHNIGGNMHGKVHSDEVSDKNEEYVIGK